MSKKEEHLLKHQSGIDGRKLGSEMAKREELVFEPRSRIEGR
jgi:hypothetical protein